MKRSERYLTRLLVAFCLLIGSCIIAGAAVGSSAIASSEVSGDGFELSVRNDHQIIDIQPDGFRFQIRNAAGVVIASAHADCGMKLNGKKVTGVQPGSAKNTFKVTTAGGLTAKVVVALKKGVAAFTVDPLKEGAHTIELSMGGLPVAYGLGDAGGWSGQLNLVTDKNVRYSLVNNGSSKRWQSSFVIFPHNGLAGVVFEGKQPSVLLGPEAYTMTVTANEPVTFHYMSGDMPTIYGNYKKLLVENGFPWIKPKSRLFELGWESWAALGYQTREETVLKSISDFQKKGYPIRWAVTGSGFWEEGGTTTSFGKFGKKFSDPVAFKSQTA